MRCLYEDICKDYEWFIERVKYYEEQYGYLKYYPKEVLMKPFVQIFEYANENIYKNTDINENDINNFYKKITQIIVDNVVNYCKGKIDIGIFLGVIKCYRKACLDLLMKTNFSDKEKLNNSIIISNFFDEVEVKACSQWENNSINEIKFNTLAEISSVLIFMYDNNNCIYVNTPVERLTGYTKDEICKMKIDDIIHKDFKKDKDIHSSERYKSAFYNYEIKIATKYGQEKWMEFNSAPMLFGNKLIMLGVGFDIGKRKRMEEALRESENSYRKLVELLPDAIYIYHDKKIIYANKAAAKLMGATEPSELLGKTRYDLLEIDMYYKTLIQQQEDIVKRKGILPPTERKFYRKSDGKFLEVETTASVISYEGKQCVLNITRDISERKRIEQLKEKVRQKSILLNQSIAYNKLKTEFFANLSHEFRTPLNVMLGAIQLIISMQQQENFNISDEKAKRYISIMKQNCFRLVRLVDNLIDITKIDAGYLQLNLQNNDIVRVVEDITLSVAEYVESRGLELIFDTDVEEKVIAFDADKVERIMLNLLSNSIKFTEAGGKIEVNIYDKKDNVVISVKDEGIGVPQEKQNEIFERFIQVDKSLSRKREGSGIGLSLVKSFVEMHKGRIYLNSEIGHGSEFVIEIPAKTINETFEYNDNFNATRSYIEKINVEFSDIYS